MRHKNNFKNTNYDLDRKVTRFMHERDDRLQKEKELRCDKEMDVAYIGD